MTFSPSLFDLSGRVALVTGGAGILGRHFCSGLAQAGANVVVADLDKESAETIAHGLPGSPLAIAVDLAQESSIANMVETITRHYGRLDILHNNAATKPRELRRFFDPVETFSLEIWQEVMRINLDAMFLVARHAGGHMASHGGGSIIQTASIYGIMAPDQRIYEGSDYLGGPINTPAVYSASKAGVVGLSRHLASYWAAQGVRVNTLTPGGVESGQNDIFREKYSARVPMGRMAQPHEMVGALVFLASDAASYITGQNIVIDGGLSVW
ncbi:3-oxoacyl-[acyl-carrier protein] reductase [plant metagenome]|uniref:3-oxoacyl-[acyl-carrier protein] reductase n=1 Tax=plant metagenome TaxID=1297885 RepID=A0A484TNW7_9ZZZZ